MKKSSIITTIITILTFTVTSIAQPLKISTSGKVGINNSTPNHTLDVVGNIKWKPEYSSNYFVFGYNGGLNLMPNTNCVGQIGQGDRNLYEIRSYRIYGNNVYQGSDKRIKSNIKNIPNSLEIVKQLSGRKWIA